MSCFEVTGSRLVDVPQPTELLDPTIDALRALGGSGSIQEIAETVVQQMRLPVGVTQRLHKNGPQTELEYRLAWARTALKNNGRIVNSNRGVWALTFEGSHQGPSYESESASGFRVEDFPNNEEAWRESLLEIVQKMPPASFERLCQLLLRESGFVEVEVTGRSGDGGIDGRGIIRFAGLIGFPVLFQCKRYSGNSTVTPSQIRDFRGAMTGRADRGLIITTGGFTQEAQKEATRDGAPPIDLINGDLLVEELKELQLGMSVTIRQIEVVSVDEEWFANI